MRIVFMGTPAFALPTLKALVEAGHDIAAVYTQPPRPKGRGQKETPSPVHLFAREHGLSVLTPTSLKTPEAQIEFKSHHAEIAVVVAYGLLLPKPILEAYPLGCINVHPSKLPRWRGAAPIQRTIMAGDKETAIVIMQMDAGLDTGDMLMIEPYTIAEETNAGMLHDALAEKAGSLVCNALLKLKNQTLKPVKQPDTGVTYAKKIEKEDMRIDWNRPAEVIYQHILGLSPAPGASFEYKGEVIKLFDASFDSRDMDKAPGTIVDGNMGIACNPGLLHPLELQRPGKKRMKIAELLNGFSFAIGDKVS
jgi:methionyl-tRNA formyltransferase